MRLMNSEMRNNMSAFDRGEKSLKKYEVQLGGLNKKLEVQKTVTESARKHYEKMVAEHGEGSVQAQKAAAAYNNESAQLNNLERHVGKVTEEMRAFKREQEIQSSGWYKTGDALESFGSKLGGVSQTAREVGGTLTRRITLPVLGITTAIGGMVAAFGWGRLTGLDSAQAQLKGLGYNTEEVGRISDQVTNAIEGGMTTMAEGTQVAAGAMAAGVKEGKDLERYIKLVGDAAVGSNRPVDEMANIFNKVQGQGKLMTRELNQIELSMPGFAQSMADNLDVTQEEFREMVTAGKISSEDFLDVMDDFAGGMAGAYADSWQGMLANTKAYIGIIGENLLGGVFDKSKESISEFIELLKSDSVTKWAEETGEKLGKAFTSLVDKIKGVVKWYRDLGDGQQKLILGIGSFVVALGPILLGLGTLGGIIAKVSSGLGVFLKFLAPIMTPMKSIGAAAGGTGKSIGILGRVLTGLTNPIGIAITIITLLATAFTTAYKKSETFRSFISDLGEKIKEIFSGIVDWVKPGMNAVIGFFNGIKQKISSFANEESGQFIEAFQNIWDFVSPILGWLSDKVKWAFDTVIKPVIGFTMEAVELLIKTIWGNIKGIITGALDVILGAIKIFSGIFTGDTEKMWSGIEQLFWGAIKVIWNWVQLQFIGRILKGISGLATGFWGHIKNLWTWVKNTFKNSISNVYNGVKNSFVGRIITSIINFVKNFKLNISNMWSSVKSTFTKWIKNIRSSIANSFVGRMLKSVRNLKTNFVKIAKDMWGGVKKQFNNIVSGAKGLPKRIGDGIRGAKSKATNGMKNVGNSLIKWAGKPFNKVVDGVNWVTGKLGIKKNIGKWNYPQYAQGTKGAHPGGLAMVNDGKGSNAGQELIKFPNGETGMFKGKNVTSYLPEGTHVFSATDTRDLLSNIPRYNAGTDSAQNFISKGSNVTGGNLRRKPWTERVWDYIKNPGKLLDIALDKFGAVLPKNTGNFSDMLKGGFNTIKDAALSKIKGTFKKQENTTNNPNYMPPIGAMGAAGKMVGSGGSKSVSNGWGVHDGLYNTARHIMQSPLGRGLIVTSGYRASSRTDHGKRNAIDLSGFGSNGGYGRVARWASRLPNVSYTIGDNVVYGRKYGDGGRPGWARGHMNHLHVSGFKTGGLIKNNMLAELGEEGEEMVIPLNAKRRPEAMKLLALTAKMIDSNNSKGDSRLPNQLPNVKSGKDNGDDKLVTLLVEQNQHLKQSNDLLTQLLSKETDVVIDTDSLGKGTAKSVSKQQDKNTDMRLRYAGVR